MNTTITVNTREPEDKHLCKAVNNNKYVHNIKPLD